MTASTRNSLIEVRSIDHIPENERHGHLFSQFTLWFGANLQITAIVTGALAVVLGGDVFWSIIGLFVGQVFGGAIMALHGAQGPKLGLPQMISSRVQFGVYGAMIPLVLACFMYLGFIATGMVLSGQALANLANVSNATGILLFAVIIVLFAFCGYKLFHILGRVMTVIGSIAFLILFANLLMTNDIGQILLENRHFSWSSFMLALSLSTSWQIAYGPYVADYSRYLPSHTSSLKTFLAVGSGAVIGTQISMTLGVFAAAIAGEQFAGNEVGYIVSLAGAGWAATFLSLTIIVGKIAASSMNAYGSFMCMATIISGFKPRLAFTRQMRLGFVLVIVVLVTCIALIGQHSFLKAFGSFMLFLLTFFTPWSAINLVDYYWVTREKYDIPALADPNGRYGRWNTVGISVYVIGVVAQMPFVATGFYTGPLAASMGDIDISWLIGIILPAMLYYVFARKRANVPAETVIPTC